ncbi:MAG: hypothetical protein GY759_11555 [Chloroflexi bacterium]|nr:hypothetical protein [Chloroflexota bacterium]
MGNRSPFTIPEAWHQTKLALKKNLFVGSRSAEGVQVILEAICEKIGLELEEVVPAAPVEPKISETEVVEVTSTPAAEEVPPEPEVDVEVPPPKIEMPEIPPPGKTRRRVTKKAKKT